MQITVNARPHEVTAGTVASALAELGYTSPSIATALNGSFVPRGERENTPLTAGDRLDVVAPMQGG